MSVNWVRGFRRMGWVVTLPLAAFVVLLFNEYAKEVTGYEVREVATPYERESNQRAEGVPGVGSISFPDGMPEVARKNLIANMIDRRNFAA